MEYINDYKDEKSYLRGSNRGKFTPEMIAWVERHKFTDKIRN